jgi:hypothetical protein
MTYPSRVRTMRVLVDGNPILAASPMLTAITGELNRIERATRRPADNRWLLTVLHCTRALDSTLNVLCDHKGWAHPTKRSLGGYLVVLGAHLPSLQSQFQGFQLTIVRPRNKYMHTAGSTPGNLEADRLLAAMHDCLQLATGNVP